MSKLDKTKLFKGFGIATADIELGDHKLTDLQASRCG
jgi:hypothetical protein